MPDVACQLLIAESLKAGYGRKQVLNGVNLEVGSGEIVALIGHNGAGKSTLLKVMSGMLPLWAGSIHLDGRRLKEPSPRELLGRGVVYVPQGSRVFTDLTVSENLEIGGVALLDRARLREGIERVLGLFPALKPHLHRRSGTLSGGEKQMLALANALLLSPRLLLLDEPSLGLAPPVVITALRRIQEISRDAGVAALIVEQKVREVLKISQRVYVLRNGEVSFSGLAETLRDDADLRKAYLE